MQNTRKIKYIGLSQVTIEQIKEARKYIKVTAVENEYNLSARSYDDVVTYTENESIVFIPFFRLHFESSYFGVLQKMSQIYNVTAAQIALLSYPAPHNEKSSYC